MRVLRTILIFTVGVAVGLVATLFHRGADATATADVTPVNGFAIESLPDIRVDVDYDGTPAAVALADLAAKAKLKLVFNQNSMQYGGLDPKMPIYLHLHRAPLSVVMDDVLYQFDPNQPYPGQLNYRLNTGVLTIARTEELELPTISQIYEVGDLVEEQARMIAAGWGDMFHLPTVDDRGLALYRLQGVVIAGVRCSPWACSDGLVTSRTWGDHILIVSTTPELQREAGRVLERLRHPSNGTQAPLPVVVTPNTPTTASLLTTRLGEVNLEHTTLGPALERLAQLGRVNIIADWPTLGPKDNFIKRDSPVNLHLHDATLMQAIVSAATFTHPDVSLAFPLQDGCLHIHELEGEDPRGDGECCVYNVTKFLKQMHVPANLEDIDPKGRGDESTPDYPESVHLFGHKLVVTATPESQWLIGEVLHKLGN